MIDFIYDDLYSSVCYMDFMGVEYPCKLGFTFKSRLV